ncbi:hypothetical protein [Zobellia barbeyronii]|uniref:Uncharacterized protein n=1 Tax=Zobellia barbeyronii TaxID=2748009 RepID=A0ABS5WHT3_9FLAO|nr:hypothetical protein [Zobellia barbeyronii]MBT2162822.1 hypothetical protein [Zobellia barbeyronii]
MKTKTPVLFLFVFVLFQFSTAQQLQTDLPKIENYKKGELVIKADPFGGKNPITIGMVTPDGTIHFEWPELDLDTIEGSDMYRTQVSRLVGGSFCKDPDAVITNENAQPLKVEYIYVYKYDQRVGFIIPTTQKGPEHRKDQLGSTMYLVYSDVETNAKANCSEKKQWEGAYSFDEKTSYNLQLKKGWNLVSDSLTEMEDWDNGTEKGSLPKTRIVESVDKVPANINWYMKYNANDEYLEIEQRLIKTKPITSQQYESWIPKKLGNLKRTNYEIGKTIERMPTKNNVYLLFEKGDKKIEVTIVDCADHKKAASMYTLMEGMASREWKDKTKTGYKSASKMDDKRVITDYDQKEAKTLITYNSNQRFTVKAEATSLTPEELWEQLKTLNLKALLED